jgi:RNA polymerase sigma factor (sigma-70 family)
MPSLPPAPEPAIAPDGISNPTQRTLEALWRLERPRIVAALARRVHDIGLAEDLAQDAMLAALQHWPRQGLPDNPAAWLMTAAKHRALDHWRHRQMAEQHHTQIAQDHEALGTATVPDFVDALGAAREDRIGDEMLRLIFTACHPVLPMPARVALTLKLLGGLSTAEIARACLQPEPTVAQRIVRAKQALAQAGVRCELPHHAAELLARLGAVLEVVYGIFNEGYTATCGDDWLRPSLCDEALRLGRMLVALVQGLPASPPAVTAEVLGLQALMELQASRNAARTDAQGRPVLLPAQDRRRWDRLLIRRGLAALAQAEALNTPEAPAGPYQLQAALAACHARAAQTDDTDWARIVALYDRLLALNPSPVVALNRAVAVAQVQGPAAALALVDGLTAHPALQRYPWLPAVRGDLLARLGHHAEAHAALLQAAEWAGNARERTLLLERAAALPLAPPGGA